MSDTAQPNQAAPRAMSQEQATIIQQAHTIAHLSTTLATVVNQRDQLGAVVKSQVAALEQANKEIERLALLAVRTPAKKGAKA